MKKSERIKKKQREAEERAVLRAARTDEEQLQKLDAGGWLASRERTRLQVRIETKKRINRSKRNESRSN